MASTSVDGLISGLSTSDVITQLMQIERQPQVRLRSQRTAVDTLTSAYQSLNARFEALQKAAEALADPAGWQLLKATTGDESRLRATAAATALPADLVVSVERLATSHTLVSERTVTGLDAVVASGPITFTVGGVAADPIDVGEGTLSSVVGAINAADAGVRAAAVQVAPGQYRLQLTAATTGAAAAFTVDPTSLSPLADPDEAGPDPEAFDLVTQGADAELRIGGAGGYVVTSASNAFSDLLPGVHLTAVKADPGVPVTVRVAEDADAVVAKVRALVEAANAALKTIGDASTYDASTGRKGVLLGNSLARQLQQDLYGALRLDLVGGSLADVGLSLRAGGLELDEAALRAAYAADPAAVVEAFTGAATEATTDGLATKLAAVADRAAHPSTGTISQAIAANGTRVADLDRQVDAWDVRLASREAALRRQYANLERALGALQSQSTWLAGQIAGLPSWETA